jgi:protein-L-isoaspartate O-methyltransferase
MTATDKDYVLGHQDPELARLEHQAAMLAPATEAILRMAGLAPGMRVLDLGTGLGDVAFAAAEIVGPSGEVVGVDRAESVLARAGSRARLRGLDNVSFVAGDVAGWQDGSRFDAVVGRLILLYCPDQPAVVRHHLGSLVPGGVYVAMEYDMPACRAEPSTPLGETARAWFLEAFRQGGMDPALGLRLDDVLRAAGLTSPTLAGLSRPVRGETDGARMLAGIVTTLLPLIVQLGVADEAEVGGDTLQDRLAAELAAAGSLVVPPTLVGAWART